MLMIAQSSSVMKEEAQGRPEPGPFVERKSEFCGKNLTHFQEPVIVGQVYESRVTIPASRREGSPEQD